MKVFNHEGTVVGQLGYDNNGGFMLISYKDGTENITIGIGENTKGGFIKVRRAEANNNFVVITNKTILVQGQKGIGGDKGYAIMTTDEDGNGIVGVRSKSNKGTAQMTVNGHGGTLFVTDGLAGGEKASLGVNEHGGRVDIFGKGTKTTRAAMGVNEYGSGTISLWDKNSYRIQR
jgi:hypothetical protein